MSSDAAALLLLLLRILLAVIFIGMGLNHFRASAIRTMAAMIPPRLRGSSPGTGRTLVILTGVCEVLGGLGLLIPQTRPVAGILLAIFLVAVFPANAYAAAHPRSFGRLAIPLVPRLIAQLVLIALVLIAGLA